MNSTVDDLDSYSVCIMVPDALRIALAVLGHGRDHVARVDVDRNNGICLVTVEWSVRCCEQSEDLEIPLAVLASEDVKHATEMWVAEQDVEKAQQRLVEMESNIRWVRESLEKAQAKLADLSSNAQVNA